MDKYLNIARLFRISPGLKKWYSKFNPTLFHLATGFFSKMVCGFLKNFPPDFYGSLFYILKHIRLNIEPAFLRWSQSVMSVRPSVRQSVSQLVRQSVSPSVRPSEFAISFSTVPGFQACFFFLMLVFQISVVEDSNEMSLWLMFKSIWSSLILLKQL